MEELENGPRKRLKAGRKPIISESSLIAAREIAEVNDLSKDSATSTQSVIDSIDQCRRKEQDEKGENSLAAPVRVSASTYKRAVRKVTPVRVKRGGIQNTSRQNALLDPRNAISCAATWAAATENIHDCRQVHSWDELSIELNGFGNKVQVLMTANGARTIRKRNLTPATTRNQGKRRTFKLGISKYIYDASNESINRVLHLKAKYISLRHKRGRRSRVRCRND